MARRPSQSEKVRLNLSLSPKVNEKLEGLLVQTDSDSISEVIRRSVAVYDHLWQEAENNGAEVVLKFPSGEEKALILK